MRSSRALPCVVFLLIAPLVSAATSLRVDLPVEVRTGTPFTFTVSAMSGSAADPAYTGTVHFTTSDGAASLPADYTFTPGDGGTHTFTATMNTSGFGAATANQSVSAIDTTASSIGGAGSTRVKWAAHLVRTFEMILPAEAQRATPFDVTVRALNSDYEVVPAYTGTVRVNSSGLPETDPPPHAFTAADQGVYTFSVTLTHAGDRFLRARWQEDPSIDTGERITIVCPSTELVIDVENDGPICRESTEGVVRVASNQSGLQYVWTRAGMKHWTKETTNAILTGLIADTYTVVVTNADGCVKTATTTIEAFADTDPSVSIPAASCGNGPVHAEVTNPSRFASFQWFATNGTIAGGQGTAAVEVTPNANALQEGLRIRVITRTPQGCHGSNGDGHLVTVGSASADILTPAAACPNTLLAASVADSGAASYQWSILNGTITSGQGTRTIGYVPTGNADVTLAVSVTKDACTANDTQIVSVSGPVAHLDATLGICSGQEATIPVLLSGTPPFRIVWSDGVEQSGIGTNAFSRVVAPEESTIYTIASVSDAACTGTASGAATVTIDDKPAIAQQPKDATIRSGESTTLRVAATGTQLRYIWYRGVTGDRRNVVASGALSSFKTPTLTSTTSYWVEVLNGCDAVQSQTATVRVAASKRRATRH